MRKPRKELPTWLNVILVLMFVVIFTFFGICLGFLIDAIMNDSIKYIAPHILFTSLSGIIYMILLIILICNSDSKNVKPIKWYINCILISLVLTLIITALTVFTLGSDDSKINYVVGFLIFPFIGIISTPNIVIHTKKDTEKWKHIFYKNGNLENVKKSKNYYMVKKPVSFEKEILKTIYKDQFLNILVVIAFMTVFILATIHHMISDNSYNGNLITNLIQLRANRKFGFAFFLMIIFLAFGIPIIAFYITNAYKKIKVVKNHEYIAYHAIVSGVHNGKIAIYNNNMYYKYDYCICVGIKEKNVHDLPATLIFIPDDVLLFPDKEDNKK